MVKITTSDIQEYEVRHLAALRALAPECMVLLKKNGDFPLSAPCPLALYGSGARQTIKGGTGSGDVNVRRFTTVEEGLENAGFTITTKSWLDAYDQAKADVQRALMAAILEEAKRENKPAWLVGMGRTPQEPPCDFPLGGPADTAVYVLARNSGEGTDRTAAAGDLLLTGDEIRDILRCAEQSKKFLLVLNVGGPVDLSPVLDKVENILLLSQLGSVTGDAFADVLLGKSYPSGRLSATWARGEDYSALGDFAERDETRYKEGIYVGYRYFDAAGITPLFPFGYGLSYTEFETKVDSFQVENAVVQVAVTVKNTGRLPGKEVVQLWYSAPAGKLDKPVRELGAYAKTSALAPGESASLTLALPIENMASWDTESAAWVLEPGTYLFETGKTACGAVELDRETVAAALRPVGGEADFIDWHPTRTRTVPENISRIPVSSALLQNKGHYDASRIPGEKLEAPGLSAFTDEELALICTGKFKEAAGLENVIGSSSFTVAGAAGETAALLQEKGYGTMILCDGPAGLRLSNRYIELEGGAEGLDAGIFQQFTELMDEQARQMMAAKEEAMRKAAETHPVCYHYASAIPIGTALAQAWNPEAARSCGDIIGTEMERFGVNVWLAPALNIHRSPLCGRNFEYYSEDPLLSGRTAAAVTQGVQSHPNCAVTIKHFCCNNQETNRFGSNSAVSQRALREIYLKGFEICVKESAPKSVMTSYNLLNGVHAANRRDLLTEVLRDEWGFTGFVMTDWGTTSAQFMEAGKYGPSSAVQCIKAGNDLVMPGSREDVDGMLAGLQGELTRKDLEICAGRLLAMAKRLSK